MSENLEKTYNPKAIEAKLYEKWCDNKYFHAEVQKQETIYYSNAATEHYR